ncbi:MAG TPA: class I SAM-dependent methyltransferase [Candidatus Angelobacter sp.]|nr:class I SAM-dependent methyltransferase [Candidatus Angelobacter sp.]
MRQLSEALFRLLQELTPGRRRAMYGDLDYDFEHSVDTTRANVPFRTQLSAALAGHQYFPTEPWLFAEIMAALPIDFSRFTFVDLGSGKGRALLMASEYGFHSIAGVEFMPALHRLAEENIRSFTAKHAIRVPLHSLCLDARDCVFPLEPLVVYMYNPFPEPVLSSVLANLRQSDEQHPRPIYLAYRYPEFQELLGKAGWLRKIAGTEQWAIYSNRG